MIVTFPALTMRSGWCVGSDTSIVVDVPDRWAVDDAQAVRETRVATMAAAREAVALIA